MLPIAASARLGIPMVDADGMGRAFPELQMVTFTIGGVKATPMALTDEKGNCVIFDTITNKWTEGAGPGSYNELRRIGIGIALLSMGQL